MRRPSALVAVTFDLRCHFRAMVCFRLSALSPGVLTEPGLPELGMAGPVNPGQCQGSGSCLQSMRHVPGSWGGGSYVGAPGREAGWFWGVKVSMWGDEQEGCCHLSLSPSWARVGALEESQDARVNGAFCPAPPFLVLSSKCPAYASSEPGGGGIGNPLDRALGLEPGSEPFVLFTWHVTWEQ